MSLIEEKIKEIIVDKLGVDEREVTPEAKFNEELGADSLDVVELIMEFEKQFCIKIPDSVGAEEIITVGDAIKYIENALTKDASNASIIANSVKWLPIIAPVTALSSEGQSTIHSNQPIAIETIANSKYEIFHLVALNGGNGNIIALYLGSTSEYHTALVNFTYPYKVAQKAVKQCPSRIPKFMETLKALPYGKDLCFTNEDNCFFLKKSVPTLVYNSSEDMMMIVFGMIKNFARDLLLEIRDSNVLDRDEHQRISTIIKIIDGFFE